VEEGWSGRSAVVRARAAAGTPCAGRTSVNWCSGEVGSERGCTIETGVGFIVAGAGLARGGARGAKRRGMLWCCQGASNTWSCYSAQVLAPAEQPNV
jgi:hypothetical protein